MTEEQIAFFNELKAIQELSINISLCNINRYEKIDDLLKDVTYEVIYRIMELLDGHKNESIKCNIINTKTGKNVNEGIELHDICEDFLDCTNI